MKKDVAKIIEEIKIKKEGLEILNKKEKDNLNFNSRASIEAQTVATIGYSCSFEF